MSDPFDDELPPLKVKCTHSECEIGLHCYVATKRMRQENKEGRCRSCGTALIDWLRVRKRDVADAAFTFESMRTEFIRHYFWDIEIDDEAIAHARKKGLLATLENVPKRLMQSVGKAQPFRDGTQTPFQGRAIYYAQHATATCCRKCVEEWHAIPKGRALTEEELLYLSQLVVLYLKERLAWLPDEGEKPAPRKRRVIGQTPLLPLTEAYDHDDQH